MRILILGGTAEARALAEALTTRGIPVISSLAGRVSRPRLPIGEVRIGGFGGVAGLTDFIRADGITHVLDATHPFAATMTRHGAQAAAATSVSFLRYARPGWGADARASGWTWVGSYDAARAAADGLGSRPFLTTGRQTLSYFTEAWANRDVLVRVVEPPAEPLPARWGVRLDRGPYDVDGERSLLHEHRIDVLLTKDSGGAYTAAKLDAAEELGIRVVVVARPPVPDGVRQVESLDVAIQSVLDEPPEPHR